MSLSHLLTTDVASAAPDTAAEDLAAAFRDGEPVVVVLDEGRPLGVITPATLGRAVVDGADLGSMTAADLLDGEPVTIRESATRDDLVSLLSATSERWIVVVDDGAFAGVVSAEDVVVDFGRELEALLDLLADRDD